MYLAGRKYSVERLPEATLGRGTYASLDCHICYFGLKTI